MEVEEGQFGVNKKPISETLQRNLEKTHEALKEMWAREEIEAATTYVVNLPSQQLRVTGKENLDMVLQTLKSVRVNGSYRATKAGEHEGS